MTFEKENLVKPTVSIIVAASDNHVIGNQGKLPWRMPADLQHFKKLTMGHTLIMGRKTYDSIGKPLPGRTTIVLSRSIGGSNFPEGVNSSNDLQKAIQLIAKKNDGQGDEVFVAGGGEIYRLALPMANRIYLTRVHAMVEGDAYFPEISSSEWKVASQKNRPSDDKNEYGCTFEIYERLMPLS